jgi:glucose/arabinose dehydrogenase
MRRALVVIVVIVIAAIGACRAFLPERFAVNAPVYGTLFGAKAPPQSELEKRLKVPPGFQVALFADGIADARELKFTPTGDLLVSSPREGAVFLLERDANGDGRADGVRKLMTGLESPQGMEIIGEWLYVAENGAVKRVRFDPAARAIQGAVETVLPGLPPGGNHWGKYIHPGPDGWIYLTIGSDCNVCIEDDPRRATIGRFKQGASDYETYASGLRNAVGFDWRPADGPCTRPTTGATCSATTSRVRARQGRAGEVLRLAVRAGQRRPLTRTSVRRAATWCEAVPPAHPFGAHVAPLGMRFYRGTAFPERYRGQAFAALHGSWNRTKKSGYKVVLLEWKPDGSIAESDFLTGFEVNEDVIGRPVDVQDGPDGALYVSDDFAGAVYRVSPTGSGSE